jgi:hypothetical protein
MDNDNYGRIALNASKHEPEATGLYLLMEAGAKICSIYHCYADGWVNVGGYTRSEESTS